MNIPNIKQDCEQAKLFYYDFLSNNIELEIPLQILKHIRRCENCQKQIFKLKSELSQNNKKDSHIQDKQGTPLVNMLKTHLSYANKNITCTAIKPFLPEILDPSISISIPTPITAHLDHCPECVKDLRKISNLHLSKTNLSRLGQLFFCNVGISGIRCPNLKSSLRMQKM